MRYLASTIIFTGNAGRILIEPYIKTIGVALNNSSAHAPSVQSWPVNMFKNIIKTAPNKISETTSICILKSWLLADPEQSKIREATARQLGSRKPSRVKSNNVFWLVLPWHPAFALSNPLLLALREIKSFAWLVKDIFGQEVEIRTAWSNPSFSDYRWFNGQNFLNFQS